MRCGLRVTDAPRLPSDCVITDADGAPYLRYFNHKMKREALVPIDEQLRGMHRPSSGAATRHDGRQDARCCFPRPTKNVDGTEADRFSSTYRLALYRLAGRLRDPRRTRPSGPADASPMAPHAREPG